MTTRLTTLRTKTMRKAVGGLRLTAGVLGWALGWAAVTGTAAGLPARPTQSLPVIVADFNHDGIPDVLVPASTGATATLALGTVPYGTFGSAKAVTFPSACTGFVSDAGNAGSLVADDLNGDGFADLVFTCTTDPQGDTLTGVMLGIGDGTFAPAVTLTTAYADGTVLGDFNHDGKLDAVVIAYPNGIYFTNNQQPAILFFAGNGDGTFAAAVSSPLGSSSTFQTGNFILGSPVAADVNGDGYPDLVLNAAYGYSVTSSNGATLTISVFGNRKDGTFGATVQGLRVPDATAAVGTYPASNDLKVIAGSFTGPGTTDFVVPDAGSPGYFLVKNTSTATTYSLGTAVKTAYAGLTAMAAGSFTGSGLTDLVVANGTSLTVLANDGTANFAANYAALSVPSATTLFAVADANFDGYSDLYTAAQSTGLGLSVNLVNGSATATSQPFSLGLGTRAVSAAWTGNVLFTDTMATANQTVNGALSATLLASSKNPSTVGDSVTFTAAVAGVAAQGTTPTGTVVFTDGTTPLGSAMLDDTGRTSLTTSALTAGPHLVTATYGSDGFYAASTSAPVAQVVNRPVAVLPTLTWATPAAVPYGTALSGTQLNAIATNAGGAAVDGTFVYTPAAGTVLNAGTQTLSVVFTPTDQTAYTVAQATVALTVQPVSAATTLSVTSGANSVSSVAAGSVVTLTAIVSAGAVPVTLGQVRFCDAAAAFCTDIHLLGTAQLTSAGTAVLRFVPGIGSHSYKAVFVGTGNDMGSASAATTLAVTGTLPTTTTLAQSGTIGNYTLTATTVGSGGRAAPTGTVSFLDTSNANAALGLASIGPGLFSLGFNASNPVSGSLGQTITTADFNGDGRSDIAVANSQTKSLTILLGTGNGAFAMVTGPATGNNPVAICAGDFNGDGKVDLAIANYLDNTLTILLGVGDGTFTPAASVATGAFPSSIAVGDINGDGRLDLVVTNSTSPSSNGSLTVLLGNGDGTFIPAASPLTAFAPDSVKMGDFNGDGKLDLAVTNFGSSVLTILLGRGDGTFTAAASPATGLQPSAVVAGDFNGDGALDLAVANYGDATVSLLLGNGDGTFTAGANLTTGRNPYRLTLGDFDGDGKTDIAVVNSGENTATVFLGTGSASFTAGTIAATGPQPIGVAAGDFNGDGLTDLAVVSNSSPPTLSILTAQPTNTVVATFSNVSPLGAGVHQVSASYPGDGLYAASVSPATSLTGQTITPVLTWTPAVSSIVYGTALGGQQLNATATTAGGTAVAGTLTYTPAAGTVLSAGVQTLRVVFTPTSNTYVPVSGSVTVTVTRALPTLVWTAPAAIAYGTALSGTQLNATVSGVGSGALPGVLTYTPAAGTVPAPGTQTLTVNFAPTDAVDYTGATASVPLTVTALVLNAITPTIARLGDPATTITLTGSGFVLNSVARVNGAALATTYVSGTTLTAVIPASSFASVGTLQISVADPSINAVSAAQPLTVIPANPAVTLSGPSTTPPGSQPSLTLAITNPYPLPLTATFNLSFASSGSTPVDDPAIQFAAGGRTLTFTVPANSITVPAIQLQAGTDAGTITIPVVLTTGGVNVTPAGLAPVVIVVPGSVPTLSTTTLTRGNGTISVAIHGFSNTREVATATFHFVAAPGATISTPDITAPVNTVFGTWFGSTQSVAFGSTFTYTQVFNVSDDAKNIGSVQVTLTNGVGASAINAAQ